MASLPSQHPTLSLHLTDRALNPILTSARSQPQLEALTSLTTTSLTAHAAATRFCLGPAQRIIVEHEAGGPVVIASFMSGADALPNGGETSSASAAAAAAAGSSSLNTPAASRPVSSGANATTPTAESSAAAARTDAGKAGGDDAGESVAPMLVGVVVAATGEEAMEARRAAGRLERVGREFQREWAAEEGIDGAAGGQ
ncbi:hypothetical protein CPLU01_01796 [Colletotrichum plurivorum]|uniref:Uncharacterized protein n=1 Tax=Colletotrichum plurivorum TaxID=2175906 RepID=A0A8H6KY33_9PEZI|nr:hypothetical protein CPLU01_01796 [Colletotrichum plurivorum]